MHRLAERPIVAARLPSGAASTRTDLVLRLAGPAAGLAYRRDRMAAALGSALLASFTIESLKKDAGESAS